MKEQVDWKYTACYTPLLFMFDACIQFIMQFLEIWQSNCLANHSFNDGFSASYKRSEGSVGKWLNRSVSINAVNAYYIYIFAMVAQVIFWVTAQYVVRFHVVNLFFIIRATARNLVCWAVTSKISWVTALALVLVSITGSFWPWKKSGCYNSAMVSQKSENFHC